MRNIDVKKAGNCLADLIQQTIDGDEVIIIQEGQPIAKLLALAKKPRKREFGSAKGLIKMADDFDKTPDDFKDYM